LDFKVGMLGIGSLGYTKGWSRATTALFIAECVTRLDIMPILKENAPKLFASLQTVHVIIGNYSSDAERVMSNRGPLIAQASVRSCECYHKHVRVGKCTSACTAH
jgi:hypothetical protein